MIKVFFSCDIAGMVADFAGIVIARQERAGERSKGQDKVKFFKGRSRVINHFYRFFG